MPNPAVGVFDLETTGIDPETDRIVTAFVGVLDEAGNVLSGQEWLIAPDGYVIPDAATAVHGVTTEHALAVGRPFQDVLPEIVAALLTFADLDIPVVAHNASYDLTMLVHEMRRYGHIDPVALVSVLDVLDTLILDKQLDRWRRGKRTLTAIAPLYGVPLADEDAHGAAADATAAGRVALKMLARPELADLDQDALRRKQTAWAREQRASFIEYRRREGDPDFTTDLNWPLYESALALAAPTPVYTF